MDQDLFLQSADQINQVKRSLFDLIDELLQRNRPNFFPLNLIHRKADINQHKVQIKELAKTNKEVTGKALLQAKHDMINPADTTVLAKYSMQLQEVITTYQQLLEHVDTELDLKNIQSKEVSLLLKRIDDLILEMAPMASKLEQVVMANRLIVI